MPERPHPAREESFERRRDRARDALDEARKQEPKVSDAAARVTGVADRFATRARATDRKMGQTVRYR